MEDRVNRLESGVTVIGEAVNIALISELQSS
jgi:hypothetical protein